MRAVLCPEQGAQKPGMLKAWSHHPCAAGLISALSDAVGLDLLASGTTAGAEQIRDTALAQPLLVATSLACAVGTGLASAPDGADGLLARGPTGGDQDVAAGHSLGSLTALALAGALTPAETVRLAAVRGRAMARCSAEHDGAMVALVAGNRAAVLAAVAAAGLTAANINGGNQIVASGSRARLDALIVPPGTRAVRLQVAGAFHSPAMAGACAELEEALAALPRRILRCGIVRDDDGVHEAAGSPVGPALSDLAERVTRPVRWDRVQRTLVDLGVTQVIELAPAGTLSGFARRDMPAVAVNPMSRPAPPPEPTRNRSAE